MEILIYIYNILVKLARDPHTTDFPPISAKLRLGREMGPRLF